jgi:pantothenate synthetase
LFINTGTGAILPSSSTVNSYTVSYTLAAGGGCAAVIATTSAEIDYVKLVDAKTLQDTPVASEGCVIVVAVVFEDVRLIDNHVLA